MECTGLCGTSLGVARACVAMRGGGWSPCRGWTRDVRNRPVLVASLE